MNGIKKFIAIFLFFTLTCSLFISCSQNSVKTDNTNSQETSQTTETVVDTTTDPYAISDNLPTDLNFNGATIRVLGRQVDDVFYTTNWEFTDELNGDVFNDALFMRELTVEGRLNINIEKNLSLTSYQIEAKSVKAGDDEFDIVFANAYDVAPLALEGVVLDLSKFPNIDYSMPWWLDTIMKDVTINGKTYFVTGDISPSVLGFMNCIFYNKKLAADYNITGLYDLVFSGQWTFDKYAAMAKQVYKDLNGNSEVDKEDLFGVTTSDYYDVYFSAFEIPITNTEADGSLSLALGDKFYSAYSKLREFSMDNSSLPQAISNENEKVNYLNDVNFFANGQLLFFGGLVRFSDYYRDMNDDFGILTVPKWDENQKDYHTTSHANYSLVNVPTTLPADRHDMVGAVIEALAAEGYRNSTPAYFESTLKNKYSRDEETLKVLDILRKGLEFQPVMIYYKSMGDILHLFRNACYPQSSYDNMTSFYEKNVKRFQSSIDKFNEYYLN
ncbi:MAG: extracellular solute-binding protein [Eubacteriales bacterium]